MNLGNCLVLYTCMLHLVLLCVFMVCQPSWFCVKNYEPCHAFSILVLRHTHLMQFWNIACFFVWFLHRPQIQSLIRAILQRADGASIGSPGFVSQSCGGLVYESAECLNQIEMLRLCLKMGWTLITNDTGSCLVTAGTLTVKMQHHIYTYTIGWHRMQHAYMHTYI